MNQALFYAQKYAIFPLSGRELPLYRAATKYRKARV
jgi:hypothetical protein